VREDGVTALAFSAAAKQVLEFDIDDEDDLAAWHHDALACGRRRRTRQPVRGHGQ
jgi:hypothetical protein